MRRVHCRKCFQMKSLLTGSCPQCGNVDRVRLVEGFGELLLYALGGAVAICAIAWTAIVLL